MFKNPQTKELLEIVRNLENKIDIINTKFDSSIDLEGCCICKDREFKIYSDLQEFLECKLNTMKDSFLNIIKENENQNDQIIDAINIKSTEHKNDIISTLSSIINVIQTGKIDDNFDLNTINQNILTTNKNLNSINSNLSNTNKNVNMINSNLSNYSKNHFQGISELKSIIDEKVSENITKSTHKLNENQVLLYNTVIKNAVDLNIKLREDFQEYLLGLETNIKNNINNKPINYNETETKIQSLTDSINSLSVKVNDFYFENELIKHQIILEEELQNCNDEILNIKELVLATKKNITDTLSSIEDNALN